MTIQYFVVRWDAAGSFSSRIGPCASIPKAAKLLWAANDYIVAVENGGPRQVTPEEEAELALCRRVSA